VFTCVVNGFDASEEPQKIFVTNGAGKSHAGLVLKLKVLPYAMT